MDNMDQLVNSPGLVFNGHHVLWLSWINQEGKRLEMGSANLRPPVLSGEQQDKWCSGGAPLLTQTGNYWASWRKIKSHHKILP